MVISQSEKGPLHAVCPRKNSHRRKTVAAQCQNIQRVVENADVLDVGLRLNTAGGFISSGLIFFIEVVFNKGYSFEYNCPFFSFASPFSHLSIFFKSVQNSFACF
jgi:hypothetical protein